jgi:hypothetical protein
LLTEAESEVEVSQPAYELCHKLGVDSVPFAYPFGDRFTEDRAMTIARSVPLSCMVGIDGLSRIGASKHTLGRARGESGLDSAVFFGPVLRAALPSLRRKN